MSSHALIIAGNLPGSTCALMTIDRRRPIAPCCSHRVPLSMTLCLSLSAYRLCITVPQQIEYCVLFKVHLVHLTILQFNRQSTARSRRSRKHRTQPADILARPRVAVLACLVLRLARGIIVSRHRPGTRSADSYIMETGGKLWRSNIGR